MRFYHHTTSVAAREILDHGFRDGEGSYGLEVTVLRGVWLSDVPLDGNDHDNFTADTMLVIDVPDAIDFDDFELIEEGKPYREWCVPAELVNRHGHRFIRTED